ncbi:insulinase family protein [Peptoniphilus sp. MSJ-1]|uniref:Insulinase family protein n=1 Tax=Peptoniphilus ovalis TaxID=2841503 RepID=A0ABS6FHR3_9FIRM|nr:insulinase family protein [Peptoniphilus ovalis]MBU5668791.1 insulinase family protein [Peptoniphilus ovalis]
MKNYKLIETKYIDEVTSNVSVYEHINTGAKVLTLENHDNNKAFGIGFRTPPEKGNGVCHIVEHCVLSGSKKYRTKEPFMDLIKSSLQTFLNAMTFPDKTIYPVSSRNKKDFYNLMDVYLDAVFYPMIHEEEKIFLQEGWHYELENKDDELKYNGVVYNEMKGVYSSSENIVADGITFALHENSSYGVDSGGDPKLIPSLSYEEFKNYHKKYYHPSNSYIYLYGDLNMEEALDYIHENYLKDFERQEIDSKVILNDELKETKDVEITFSASKEEMKGNVDYLAQGWTIGYQDNKMDVFMRDFLSELLIDAQAAPLKKKIFELGLAEDVYAETSSSLPLDLSIVLKNTDADKKDEFVKVLRETLEDLVKNGIDRDFLQATLNKFEFIFREGGGTQKAIIYYIRALNSWLYDSSPLDSLFYNDVIEEIKSKIDDGFVEKYIEEKILNNNYSVVLSARPELDKNEKQDEELRVELQNKKENMTDEEIEEIIRKTKELDEYQSNEDSDEAKATIPSLEIEDIDEKVTHYDMEEDEIEGIKLIKTPRDTNGIVYTTISTEISHVEKSDLEKVQTLVALLGLIDTENYSYEELNNEIYKATGGIGFYPTIYVDSNDNDKFSIRLNIKMKSTSDNVARGLEIIREITENSKFDSKKRISELLFILKSRYESTILQSGHQVIASIVKSYYSKTSDLQSHLGGIDYYNFLKELTEDFENKFDGIKSEMEKIYHELFHRDDLIISLTGDIDEINNLKPEYEKYINSLKSEKYERVNYDFKPNNKNEGIYTTSNVVYVSKGYDLSKLGLDYKGDIVVLQNILNSSYLHNEIRAKGGAYGAGVSVGRNLEMATYSYRDPNLTNTLKVYDEIGEYIRNLKISDEELKNFIIGSLNAFDPLLSPAQVGDINLSRYITGLKEEDLEKSKKEALATSIDGLKSYADIFDKAMNENYFAALGSEKIIKDSQKIFKEVKSLK